MEKTARFIVKKILTKNGFLKLDSFIKHIKKQIKEEYNLKVVNVETQENETEFIINLNLE